MKCSFEWLKTDWKGFELYLTHWKDFATRSLYILIEWFIIFDPSSQQKSDDKPASLNTKQKKEIKKHRKCS